MNFYFSSKVIKESQQEDKFQKNNKKFATPINRNQTSETKSYT